MDEENNWPEVADESITNKIYLIREESVMIDRDLAVLYGVETKRLKEAVRRNINRFPEDFMFELTQAEFSNWRSQFATSNSDKMGLRIPPFAFTEHGVLMLASVLSSERAIQVNIQIVRIFSRIRKVFTNNLSLKLEIEEIKNKLKNQDKNIELVFTYLDEIIEKQTSYKPRTKIGYKRQSEED